MEIINTARVECPFAELPGDTLPLPTQAIFPGFLQSAYRRELQNLSAHNALARLLAQDASLWPAEQFQTESLKSNLRWLDLPGQLGPLLARVAARALKIEPAGFEDVVFVTMGDSNLAAESILRLPAAKRATRTFLLQTPQQKPPCSTTSIPIPSAPSMKCCTSTGPSLSLPTNQANTSRHTPCSCIFSKD